MMEKPISAERSSRTVIIYLMDNIKIRSIIGGGGGVIIKILCLLILENVCLSYEGFRNRIHVISLNLDLNTNIYMDPILVA